MMEILIKNINPWQNQSRWRWVIPPWQLTRKDIAVTGVSPAPTGRMMDANLSWTSPHQTWLSVRYVSSQNLMSSLNLCSCLRHIYCRGGYKCMHTLMISYRLNWIEYCIFQCNHLTNFAIIEHVENSIVSTPASSTQATSTGMQSWNTLQYFR